jgi:dihydrolipoamide dehydrogenase
MMLSSRKQGGEIFVWAFPSGCSVLYKGGKREKTRSEKTAKTEPSGSTRRMVSMKRYDLIAIGTGSAMNVAEALLQTDPEARIAVIDKDDPGGICLTRGCIPSKLLIYPAELIRTIEEGRKLGLDVRIEAVDFKRIMERMRALIGEDIEKIRANLSASEQVDYYPETAEFIGPYRLKVGNETITSKKILLCTGSRPRIPPLEGLEQTGYHTSDTLLGLQSLPPSLIILGGGYIAAEYGHFFSAMGCRVSIIGRNPRFLPQEEPEISAVVQRELSRHLRILTGLEAIGAERNTSGKKKVLARNRSTGETVEIIADEILVAVGRAANTDLLHPERSAVKIDEKGWIWVNEYLETSRQDIWAFGDAVGRYPFKHVANYESRLVYYNAVQNQKIKADYHAVPHAIFCTPEVAAVGMGQQEAL